MDLENVMKSMRVAAEVAAPSDPALALPVDPEAEDGRASEMTGPPCT
jgi:hypothetical protein